MLRIQGTAVVAFCTTIEVTERGRPGRWGVGGGVGRPKIGAWSPSMLNTSPVAPPAPPGAPPAAGDAVSKAAAASGLIAAPVSGPGPGAAVGSEVGGVGWEGCGVVGD